ncbi:hypothetical protein [Aquimarina pacifica]|uniref:hypothetical protein n=1 Tax=Aquimarina pacifica TaxID=1296415 RepID=UPI000470F76D|nr:hypothetical protein [Aquimarina pacifica]
MIKFILYISSLFLFVSTYANDSNESLEVVKEGLVVLVVDFNEGDKIKLFEVETGDHILSKTHGEIDLSQLPLGSYLLEDNNGKSIVIERLEENLMIEGVEENIEEEFVLAHDSERARGVSDFNTEKEFIKYYDNNESNILHISREGDVVTVLEFEEGDKIKLFEVKNTVHILSKTVGFVDMSQLPEGLYVLENDKGDSVVIEKFSDSNHIADM